MQVNTHEAKTQLSKLLDRAAAGEEIIIARAGRPVARLVPFREERGKRRSGQWRGQVWLSPDFDDTSVELIRAFEGEGDT